MSTRLVILGLLRNGSLHGYELKHIIEEHMGDWTNIAYGSIYFALGKLREEGFIATEAANRTGRRPEKTVYAITKDGKNEFIRLLRETLRRQHQQYFDIDIAMAFIDALDPVEARELVCERMASLEKAVRYLDIHESAERSKPEIPEVARLIFSHGRAHLLAELDWTREVLVFLDSVGFAPNINNRA